jgi:Mrp family chromosome partitioning ATPase
VKASTLPSDRETGMFRLYAWAMIITVGLAVAVALLGTRTAPQYSATAEVLIGPTITPSGNYIEPSMPTEQRVATSADVIGNAAAKLGVTSKQAMEHLSVTVPVDTEVLVMSYTDDSPAAALSGAKVFAETYLRARNPEDGKNPVASLISPPERPSTPVGINYPVILGAAVVAGLLIGFGVARAWDRVRGRIRTVADAERCADLDALVVTPQLPRTSIERHPRFLAGRSQLTSLAARVLGEVEDGPRSSLLVTGAASDCGSTAVAATTAVALARMGRVVVLVTADDEVVARMSRDRNPKRTNERTSTNLWPDARPAEQEGLHLVSVAEWDGAGVAAARLTNLLPELHQRLPEALIVIDGPPAWSSAGIALRVDKILLVVALGRGSRKALATAVQALDHCAEKMMGLVITPRGGRTRHEVASVREWADRHLKKILFRIAPPAMDPESVSGGWSGAGATPAPPVWTETKSIQAVRSSVAASDRTADVARRPNPKPSGEPTSSVAS